MFQERHEIYFASCLSCCGITRNLQINDYQKISWNEAGIPKTSKKNFVWMADFRIRAWYFTCLILKLDKLSKQEIQHWFKSKFSNLDLPNKVQQILQFFQNVLIHIVLHKWKNAYFTKIN